MNGRRVARLRLRNLGLARSAFATPEEVVRRLGAMQSQELAAARWSIGQRLRGATEGQVTDAIARGEIVRTHLLRPTWHFVAAADLRWLLELSAPRVHVANAHPYKRTELSSRDFGRSQEVMSQALGGGTHLTRDELAELFRRAGISVEGQRLAYLLMRGELDGVVCSGVPKGNRQTYALLEERVPPAPARDRDESLLDLTLRFFRSRGPAALEDYRWWSGLTAADTRRGVEIAGAALRRIEIGGRDHWLDPDVADEAPRADGARLLQGYDEYFVGYTPTGRWVADLQGLAALLTGDARSFIHSVVIDGQLVARWRRVARSRSVAVEMQLLRPLSTRERQAIDRAVRRYARFVGQPATWSEWAP